MWAYNGAVLGAISVGVVGLGAVAQRGILPLLVRSPHFDLKAICSPSQHQLDRLGKLYGVEHTYTMWEDLLAVGDIQALVVLDVYRQDIIMTALEQGLHVLTAAPLAYNSDEARAIRDLADEKETVVMVAHLRRYDRSFERAERLVQEILNQDDARLLSLTDIRTSAEADRADLVPMTDLAPGVQEGRMALAELSMENAMGEGEASMAMRIACRTLLDASEQVSILRGLAGRPKQLLHAQMTPMGNFILVTLGYPGELLAQMTIGRTHRFRPEERLEVHGVLSSLVFSPPDVLHDLEDGLITRVSHDTGEEQRRSYRVGPARAVENTLEKFAECIRERCASPTGTHPGVEEVELLEAILGLLKKGASGV